MPKQHLTGCTSPEQHLARTQLEAFNQLQRESREQNRPRPRARTLSPSPLRVTASYRQRPSQLPLGICTPPTPRRPSSSPKPPREDSETLPDAPEQHSPTPSVIGWDTYMAENQPSRQATDRYVPDYTERTHLPSRHPYAPERARPHKRFNHRNSEPRQGGEPHRYEAEGIAPSQEDATSGVRGRGRGRTRGRGHGRQRAHSLHECIRF